MTALDKLPFETLVQILSCLATPDLAQMSLVCRRFSAVSESLLYQSPDLAVLQRPESRMSLVRFIETLIHSPRTKLGTHVRSVSVQWDYTSGLGPTVYPVCTWPIAFRRPAGFHGIHCVLLLHILPSVRELHITPPRDLRGSRRGYISHCLEAPQAGVAAPTLQLQSLRKFSCPYATNRGGITFGAVLALLKLPCIEFIDTHMTDIPLVPPDSSNNVRFSTVTSLRLWVSKMWPLSLSVLLSAPVALTWFSYVAFDNCVFDMSDFTTALSPLQTSLEYLHLDMHRTSISFTSQKADSIRGSFHLWPALHTLRCSTRELLGYCSPYEHENLSLAEVLPRSLRRLDISMDPYWLYEHAIDRVISLLATKDEVVPVLESVAMGNWFTCDEPAYERLRVACKDAGVSLVAHELFSW